MSKNIILLSIMLLTACGPSPQPLDERKALELQKECLDKGMGITFVFDAQVNTFGYGALSGVTCRERYYGEK